MSNIKQISFSPEYLEAPEVKTFPLPNGGGCDLSSKSDLSTIEFASLPINTTKLSGGAKIDVEQLTSNQPNTTSGDSYGGNYNSYGGGYESDDDSELTPVNFNTSGKEYDTGELPDSLLPKKSLENHIQHGGLSMQIESDTTIDEITSNPDNPDEDPEPADDKISDNDSNYESQFNVNISNRIKEIEDITAKIQQSENNEEDQKLINVDVKYNVEFDLNTLRNKLSDDMDLYWAKELDQAYVELKIKEYIDNYNSTEYKTYKSMLEYVMSKTKAGYTLTFTEKGEYILHRGDVTKYEIKLTPPTYLHIDVAMKDIQKELVETEFKLNELKYALVENSDKIMEDDMITFRKLQKKYYELAHQKVIITGYVKQINKKEDNPVQMYLNFVKKKANPKGEMIRIIETNYVDAPKSFRDDIRNTKIASLEVYNEIKNMNQSYNATHKITKEQQKSLHTNIKKYLTTGTAQSTVNITEQYNKKLQKEINFIVFKKPVIDVKKSSHKDKDKVKDK